MRGLSVIGFRVHGHPMPLAAATLACMGGAGCVERTISISSEPPGALVWLNDREVGRTPLQVGFTYYGTYDLRLEREGYDTLLTSAVAAAPWWETVGVDLFAELTPARLRSRVTWHFVLERRDDDPEALLGRAERLRGRPDEADQ